MSKKYKIVLSQVDYGVGLMPLFQVKEELDEAKRDFQLNPDGYKDKVAEMESRLRGYDEVAKQIATMLGLPTSVGESVFNAVIAKNKLGIPAAIAAFKTILQPAKLMGLQGEDLLDFIYVYLDKSTDLVRVAPKIAEDLKKIFELSQKLEILPSAMLKMFKDSLINNNFDQIFNLVAIAPLLKIDFKTISVKQISNTSLATEAIGVIQSVSQTNLDLSAQGELQEELIKSQHKVEFAYNDILKDLDLAEINRSKKFNESLAKDMKLNPSYYYNLNNFHMELTGRYQRIRNVYEQVGRKTMQAPGDETKSVKSFNHRKIRIITAATPAENLQYEYNQIKVEYNKIVNFMTLMKKEKLDIENYLKPAEKTGELLEIITSEQNYTNAKKSIAKFNMYLVRCEAGMTVIKSMLTSFLSYTTSFDLTIPALKAIKEQADQLQNDLETAKEAELEQFRLDNSRFKMLLPILDDLKSLDDKIALYNQYKENIKPKSAKFRVKFNWVDPATGDVSSATMPRYSFINWVYNIGLDIVSKISSIANKYIGVGGEAGIRSAVRLNKEALKFKTENQNWAESNMDVQAPLVEEFRK